MFKNFINHQLRAFALLSLFVALAGVALASPGSATAASCNGPTAGACASLTVHVYDAATHMPINNAKVALIDTHGITTYAYEATDAGAYAANVTPGYYKVYVSAPGYLDSQRYTTVVTGRPNLTNAPLAVNNTGH